MEKALRYVLEVYRNVRQSRLTRIQSVKLVAKKYRISNQSVMSACTRDIGIDSAMEFDELIETEYVSDFRTHLIKRFPSHQQEINEFFKDYDLKMKGKQLSRIDFLFEDEKKHLLNQIYLDNMKSTFIEWVSRPDLPNDIRDQMNIWIAHLS